MSGIAQGLFATLFPSDCRLCGTPLVNISRLPVCEDCLAAMKPIAGEVCSLCGERMPGAYALSQDGSNPRCGLCRRVEPPFTRAVAYGSYDGGLRELIHLLKYAQVTPAATMLGGMLARAMAAIEPSLGAAEVLVIPVPLHGSKLRQRGFNQSELVVRAALKFRPAGRYVLRPQVLKRSRLTQSQTGLTRHQRRENIRGAFAVKDGSQVAGREILLVDDVFTTGTTVSECARVLRRAGASKVWVATVARTLKGEPEAIGTARVEPQAMAVAG